ncbi:hypothetical protein HYT74_00880 [Candidatus Daviesbacteria bacterium]|nr:hypothetical protein [Candidatus Daviesbacteria bacterium]
MKKFLPLVIFLVLSAGLIISWFRFGLIYGGGDVGLQTYNPQRILENARFVWWDASAPGAAIPQGLSAVPFQFILFLFQSLGFSPLALQATLFFALLFLMGYGMYLFLEDKFEHRNKLYPVIGGLFYMLNPYMMIQVWHRFIHTTIIFAAALPFLAIFWNNWIKEGKVRYLLFFLLTTVLSVYAFGTYAFILAVWIFLSLLTIGQLVPWKGKKQVYAVGLRFVFGFIVWMLINAWWMVPVSQIAPAVLSEQHRTEESLMTLITISAQEILPYSLQLINPFYLFFQAELGTIYKNMLFQVIPWVFVAIILFGLINSIKHKAFSMYGIFYLLALFLAKGAAPPFGNVYIFGFTSIFALGVLRNPFEKTGLILIFFSTVLFALGLKILSERFGKLPVIFICFLIFVFSWPMLLGKVIGRPDQPAFVEVPKSYQEADAWFLEQKKGGILDGKILHLPLTQEESIQYNWKFGYNGLEPSDTFFTAYPSISRGFNSQRVDDALSGLGLSFQSDYIDSARILGNLQDFNVRFIVLHKDVSWTQDLENILGGLEFLNKRVQFGDLIVYQLKDQYFKPKIAIEHDVNLIYPGDSKLSIWPALVKDPTTKLITPLKDLDFAFNEKQQLVFPKSSFLFGLASNSASPVERLKSLKPILAQRGMIQSLSLADKVLALTEALNSNMDDYGKILKQIFPKAIEINKFQINGEESLLSSIFRIHIQTLQNLRQNTMELEKYLVEFNLKPKFFDRDTDIRQVFKFDVPTDGILELMMLGSHPAPFLKFYINDMQVQLEGKVLGNTISFGNLDLQKGEVEISYPMMLSENIASDSAVVESNIEIPINTTEGESTYKFSGNVRIDQGSGFYISFYENQNPQPSLREFLQTNPQIGWQTFQINLQTKPTTRVAKIVISPVGSQVTLSDIKVQKVLNNQIFLRSSRKEQVLSQDGAESVEFTRQNAVLYRGKIKLLSPGFLFFKETFHPGWKLSLISAGETFIPKQHFLASLYGNAWYIDKAGEYEFKIEFEPQKYFIWGISLSGLGLILIGFYSLRKRL